MQPHTDPAPQTDPAPHTEPAPHADAPRGDPLRSDPLRDWLAHVAAVLDVDPALVADVADPVLDMVRDVAHGVVRPAGPMTAFLVGVVAGRAAAGGADGAAVETRVGEALAAVEDELRRHDAAR